MSQARDLVKARLPRAEGDKQFAYNDATGQRVTCRPQGNLSIAIGINLETGLDATERAFLEDHRLGLVETQLTPYAWYAHADPVRQSVFLELGFNDGVAGLLHFPHMLSYALNGDWGHAADELLNSDAARKLASRYKPLAQLLRDGSDPNVHPAAPVAAT